MRIAIEQRLGVQNHGRRAESTLHGAMVQKSLLDGIERVAVGHTLDGQHLRPFRLRREHETRIDGLPIYENRAGAAFARLAAALHAEVAVAAQHIQQNIAGGYGPLLRFPVHAETNFHGFHSEPPVRAAHSSSARLTSTRTVSRRYSAEARMSLMGRTSRATSSHTSARVLSSTLRPTRSFSALTARMGVGATAPSAIRTHFARPLESN